MIQGFGNVGYWASKFIVENGGRIIGVAEFNSGIVCPAGIDPDRLLRYKEENDTLLGFPGAETEFDVESMHRTIETVCDVLVPAALQKQIHRGNAGLIRAKVSAGTFVLVLGGEC